MVTVSCQQYGFHCSFQDGIKIYRFNEIGNNLLQVADPTYLRVSPLSPDFLQRQNLTLFGSAKRLPVEKLRNPAGFEFEVATFERTACVGVGSWTSEASWYPGYLWKACVCPKCRAHLGWMFEPEDSATEDQKRPSEAGFYAIILDKVIDEVRFVQSHFVFSFHIHYWRLLYASIFFCLRIL